MSFENKVRRFPVAQAGSLVRGSLWLGWLSLLVLTSPVEAQFTYSPPSTSRQSINLDTNWLFIQQDVPDAQATNFDDSSWTNLNLPHSWDIPDGQSYPGSNYYQGIGWYRTYFKVANNGGGGHGGGNGGGQNLRYFLKFDGAFLVADVYVNGNFVGEHQGGFSAFVFDVTTNLVAGATNVVAVKLNNGVNSGLTTNIPPLAGDFTFWGGIYRDVHLLVTDQLQVSPMDYGGPGLYVSPFGVSATSANISVTTVVSNANSSPQDVAMLTYITDENTNILDELEDDVQISGRSATHIIDTNFSIFEPELWSGPSNPYLYQAFVEVYSLDQNSGNYNLTDAFSQQFGVRSFSVNSTNGFSLNGAPYDLHGVELPQDWINSGWALTDAQRATNFAFVNEIGATAVRLPYFQNDDDTYNLADQNGVILWSELPLIGALPGDPSSLIQQAHELVHQEFNHPSVVCWGMFDDVTNGAAASNLVSQIESVVATDDPSRLITAATTNADNDPTTFATPLIGFNKYFGWYQSPINGLAAWADNFHANNPTLPIGISEYGAGGSIYQHTENPTEPANTATNFHPEEWQNLVHETNWQAISARPYLWTKFVWNLFDYASDSRNEGDTPGRNDSGLVTYDRQTRKDAFYYYKANWTTSPMVYITGHTFTNRMTNLVTAKIYANCTSVQLSLNGVSQGTQTSTNFIFTWPLSLLRGSNTVVAIGSSGGIQVTNSLVWIGPIPPLTVSVVPTNGQIFLNWTPYPGALSYEIERGTSSGNETTLVATNVTTTNYTDTGLINGSGYYYLVLAVGPGGVLGTSTEISAIPFPNLNVVGTYWTNTVTSAAQNWNANANWSTNAVFPNNTNAVAVVYDGITTNQTINLNQAITVGSLTMGVPGGSYTIAAKGGTLTFNNAPAVAPLVQLSGSQSNTISAPMAVNIGLVVTNASSNAFILSGNISGATNGITYNGSVTLSGTNTYSGGTIISSNTTLLAGSASANSNAWGTGPITLQGGAIQFFGYGGSTSTDWGSCSNALNVPAGQTGTLLFPPVFGSTNRFSGALTGGGTLNLTVDYVRDSFSGNWSAFTGQINVSPRNGSGDFRINNASGYSNAAVWLNSGANLYNINATSQTTDLGELGGASGAFIGPGSLASAYPTWRIGAKNTTNTYAGVVADSGITSLIKIGTGTLVLSGPNTYTGPTTVSAGMLIVNNTSGTGIGFGVVTVAGGATLGGAGGVGGATTIKSGATLTPGNPMGVLTFDNSLTLAAGSTTLMSISQSPLTNSSVVVLGAITNGGALIITNLGGTLLKGGETFALFNAASYSGTFASVVLPTLYPGVAWNTNQLNTAGKVSVVFTTQLTLQPLSTSAQGLVFSGSGGVPNATNYLLSSTNIAMPLSNWTRVLTNLFDASGNFSFTNPPSGLPRGYYILQLP